MISREEIDNLANLARLELDDAQKASLGKDLDSILGYFDQLKEAQISDEHLETKFPSGSINVMREDKVANHLEVELPSGSSTSLVEMAPKNDGQYIRVKKIL